MNHASVVFFDNALRAAWHSNAQFPLSAGLYASSSLKRKLNARIRQDGKVYQRRYLHS